MKTAEQYWREAMDILAIDLAPIIIDTFIKPLIPLRYEGNNFIFTISIEIGKYRDTVKKLYSKDISEALSQVFGKTMYFQIYLPNEDQELDKPAATTDIRGKVRNINGIIPNYTFDNFIVGPSNEMAHASALAVAENPGEIYNPLFLYGGVGLGKTHLMHAVGNYVMKKFPDFKVLYVTTEKFTNDYIESLRNKRTVEFRDKYRKIDLLLLDDVQFLANKESTQEEFFHTFNDLVSSGRQIIMCSDRKPYEINTLADRLINRMEAGLITDISFPDFETRTAILDKKADLLGLKISNDVIEYIANSVKSNVREMEGILTRIIAYAKVTNKIIDVSLAEEAVKDIIKSQRTNISVEYIQDVVANYYKITVDELKSKRRTKPLTIYRHIAMYLCRKFLDDSLEIIGKKFGGRDHSTVMNGCDKVCALIESDNQYAADIAAIEKRING
ncbi:MAG: chromosomal replication initiator protein DnaA [Lachnospirales bacterium]